MYLKVKFEDKTSFVRKSSEPEGTEERQAALSSFVQKHLIGNNMCIV